MKLSIVPITLVFGIILIPQRSIHSTETPINVNQLVDNLIELAETKGKKTAELTQLKNQPTTEQSTSLVPLALQQQQKQNELADINEKLNDIQKKLSQSDLVRQLFEIAEKKGENVTELQELQRRQKEKSLSPIIVQKQQETTAINKNLEEINKKIMQKNATTS